MFYRKRMYPTAMQATFPGVNGVNTIVIGQAELTADKTSTRWVLTVLHEHFHQLVYSQPGYYADVEKLGVAHGDKTGMWMLNYPFQYDSARVQEKFTAMTHALLDALAQTDQPALEKKVAARWCIRSAPPRRCCWTARGRSGSGTFSHTASDSRPALITSSEERLPLPPISCSSMALGGDRPDNARRLRRPHERHRCDLQWRPRSVGVSRPSDGIAPR